MALVKFISSCALWSQIFVKGLVGIRAFHPFWCTPVPLPILRILWIFLMRITWKNKTIAIVICPFWLMTVISTSFHFTLIKVSICMSMLQSQMVMGSRLITIIGLKSWVKMGFPRNRLCGWLWDLISFQWTERTRPSKFLTELSRKF